MSGFSASQTYHLLKQHGFKLKKSLGQNFLMDENVLNNIVKSADIDQDTSVLEIGPGAGALTGVLAQAAEKVVAVEIDQRLKPVLKETMNAYENVELVFEDVLKADLRALIQQHFPKEGRLMVVANLPYYVTTPILMRFLTESLPVDGIVVMVQKEVAERLQAEPGQKSYGSLSVAVQYHAHAEIVMKVPKTVFVPNPNVDSAVIRLDMRENKPVQVKDEDFLFRVVKACFAQRRKTLLNNLTHNLYTKDNKQWIIETLESIGIDPMRRGETMNIGEFGLLSDALLIKK